MPDSSDHQHGSFGRAVHADKAVETVEKDRDFQRKENLEKELTEIWAAIKRLTDMEQRIMQMRYSQGFTDQEIAMRLGISSEDVRKSVNRARAYIKECVYLK